MIYKLNDCYIIITKLSQTKKKILSLLMLLLILNASFASGEYLTDKIALSYTGTPIRQVMFADKSGFIAMGGIQPFTYNMNQNIDSYAKMVEKSYLTDAKSSMLKRLENGNIAMVCGKKLLWTFNDQGSDLGSFTVANSFDTDFQCSLNEIAKDTFLISSVVSSKISPLIPTGEACPYWKYFDSTTKTCKSYEKGKYYDKTTKTVKTCGGELQYDYIEKICVDRSCFWLCPTYKEDCNPPQWKGTLSSCVPNSCTGEKSYLLQVVSLVGTQFAMKYAEMICLVGDTFQINCEAFTQYKTYFCAYSSNGIKGKLFTNEILDASGEYSFAPVDYYYSKLFRFYSNTLVIFFMSKTELYGKLLTYNGYLFSEGPQKAIVLEEDNFAFKSIDITKVSDDMLLALLLSNQYVFIRKFYKTLEANGPLIKILSGTENLGQASIGGLSETQYGLLFSDTKINYIILVEFPKCKSTSYKVVTGKIQKLEGVTENGIIGSEKIIFTRSVPLSIKTEMVKISLNTVNNLKDTRIGFNQGGVYEYSFILIATMNGVDIHSQDCTAKIECCYISCKTCTVFGKSIDNKCTSCASGYFFSEEGQCTNVLPPGYYVDTSDNKMKPCHRRCETCNAGGADKQTNCLKCKYTPSDKFYPNPILPSHCQNEPIDGYYIDDINKKYAECYKTCKTCIEKGDDTNHRCEKCKDGFTKSLDPNKDKNCVQLCPLNQYFYFDSEKKPNCLDPPCPTDYPVFIPDKKECAKECEYSYYESIDKTDPNLKICVSSCSENGQFYYLENGARKCVASCEDEQMVIDPITKVCLTACPREMYLNEENECIETCPPEMYYEGKKCVKECKDYFIIELLEKKCVDNCPIDFYIKEKQCVGSCKPEYVDPLTKKCLSECKDNVIDQPGEMECVAKCPSSFIHDVENHRCVSQCPEVLIYDIVNKQCVTECPNKLIHDIVNNKCDSKCTSIHDIVNNKCVSKCLKPLIHDIVNNKCVNKCLKPLIHDTGNNQCVDKCTESLIHDTVNNQCVDKCTESLIHDTVNNQCVNECPKPLFNDVEASQCVKECPKQLIHDVFKMKCVSTCDAGLYLDEESRSCDDKCPPGKPKDEENKKCLSGCDDGYYVDPISQTCKEIICLENEFFAPSMNKCVTDCKALDLLFDTISKTCLRKCPEDRPIINLITKVCMTQPELDKELTDRIKDLNNNIKDLAQYYPSIGQEDETFKIYNSTDLDKEEANNPIYLGDCEKILKETYSIPMNDPLLIVRWEPPKSSYSFIVYAQDGRLLDLNMCSSSPIIVEAPVNSCLSDYSIGKEYSDKSINLFNESDPFFTDICYPSWKNVDQVDIPLYRRQEQLFIPKSPLCFDNCSVKSVNYEANTVQCDCAVVQTPFEFPNTTSFWNQMLAICYVQVFNENFYMNIGFLAMSCLVLIQVGMICFFLCTRFKSLMIYLTHFPKHMEISNGTTDRSNQSNPSSNALFPSNKSQSANRDISVPSNPPKVGDTLTKTKADQFSESTPAANQESVFIKLDGQDQQAELKKSSWTNKGFSRYEMLSDMEYVQAKIYDNRPFCMLFRYYCIRTQPFLNAFFIPSNKRIKAIRISLFFLDISIDLFFNALFFTDDIIGIPFDFVAFLPKTIYASLCGMVLKKIMSLIPSTVYRMRKFQIDKDLKDPKEKAAQFLKSYKPFIWLYFILATLLSLGMWYYVAAFCGVYQYTQVNWLIGSALSFGLAQVFPLFFALVISLMRMLSLKNKQKWLYELQIALSPFY